jgi:hypothetical protein
MCCVNLSDIVRLEVRCAMSTVNDFVKPPKSARAARTAIVGFR